MTTYLAIITTALVVTQIIRVVQNTISLHRQSEEIKRNIKWIKDNEVTEEDFKTQREVYRLLKAKLEEKQEEDNEGDY